MACHSCMSPVNLRRKASVWRYAFVCVCVHILVDVSEKANFNILSATPTPKYALFSIRLGHFGSKSWGDPFGGPKEVYFRATSGVPPPFFFRPFGSDLARKWTLSGLAAYQILEGSILGQDSSPRGLS